MILAPAHHAAFHAGTGRARREIGAALLVADDAGLSRGAFRRIVHGLRGADREGAAGHLELSVATAGENEGAAEGENYCCA